MVLFDQALPRCNHITALFPPHRCCVISLRDYDTFFLLGAADIGATATLPCPSPYPQAMRRRSSAPKLVGREIRSAILLFFYNPMCNITSGADVIKAQKGQIQIHRTLSSAGMVWAGGGVWGRAPSPPPRDGNALGRCWLGGARPRRAAAPRLGNPQGRLQEGTGGLSALTQFH